MPRARVAVWRIPRSTLYNTSVESVRRAPRHHPPQAAPSDGAAAIARGGDASCRACGRAHPSGRRRGRWVRGLTATDNVHQGVVSRYSSPPPAPSISLSFSCRGILAYMFGRGQVTRVVHAASATGNEHQGVVSRYSSPLPAPSISLSFSYRGILAYMFGRGQVTRVVHAASGARARVAALAAGGALASRLGWRWRGGEL